MKKVLSLLTAFAMAATMLVGCGGASDVKDPAAESGTQGGDKQYKGVTLNMWSMWSPGEPQANVLNEAAKAFEDKTGAKVEISFKGREINKIIQASLEAKDDIDIFEDDYQRIANTYKDYVTDLTDMAKAANYDAQSYACLNKTAIEWAGFLPCITEQPQVGGVFYNQDIFKQLNIQVPTTWDEFMTACQTMKDNGIAPMALDSAYTTFNFGYHLARAVGQDGVIDLATNGGWAANEAAVKAADQIIDFVNKGYLAEGAPDEYPSSQDKIGLTGDVAMVVCANYVAPEVNQHSGKELNWGMFNYPALEGGADAESAYAGANSLAIPKNSKNPQAAFDFCIFLTSGEMDQKMADTAQQIPADPHNTAPAVMNGTVETLMAADSTLEWNMGLNRNSELQPSIQENITKLYEGKFATGAEFAAAMDALY